MIPDITITSLETITAYSLSGNYLWQMDELQDATFSNTQEKTDITGKNGRKLNSLKRNKACKITGTNGLLNIGAIQTDTGTTATYETAKRVLWYETVTVGNSNGAVTAYTAVGTTGAEILACYVLDANGLPSTKLVQDSSVAAGKFTYTPGTKALTFHTDVAEGAKVYVQYKRNVTCAAVVANGSENYSEKVVLYVDAFGEDACSTQYRVQFYVPKADFSGNFDIKLGGDQTTHGFEAESLAGGCTAAGNFWEMYVFGMSAVDTPV